METFSKYHIETSNDHKSGWINGLDSIRFVLALTVLLYHYSNPWAAALKGHSFFLIKIIGSVMSVAFCGVGAVMAFFIISGFVIHYPNKKKLPDTKKFLLRRWLRIGLPLVVITIICLMINHFDFIPVWSLYCEIIYYTLYPVLARLPGTWKLKTVVSFTISYIIILWLSFHEIQSLFLHANIDYDGNYWQLGTSLTWLIGLPCWLLGVLLADEIDYEKPIIAEKKVILTRVIIVLAGCFLTAGRFHFFLSYIVSMNLFALLLYYWIETEIRYYRNNRPWFFFEYAGRFSYSIYLCHNLCFFITAQFIQLNNFTYLIYIFTGIALSYFYYVVIENPSHKLAKYLSAKI